MPCSILSVLPTLDSEPKRYQNSGLRKDLKKNSKVEETFDPFQSGGLDDEDASSTRPAFPRTQRSRPHVRSEPEAKDLKRDQSRKNNVSYRFIFSLYLSSYRHPQPVCSNWVPGKRRRCWAHQEKGKGTYSTFEFLSVFNTVFWFLITQGVKTAKATVRQPKPVKPQPVPSGNTRQASNQFLKDRRWARVFIPTLMHAFYISRGSFTAFTLDSPDFIDTVQNAFNISFPNVDFALSPNDEVTITVCKLP